MVGGQRTAAACKAHHRCPAWRAQWVAQLSAHGQLAGRQLPQHHAQAVHVGLGRAALAPQHLGRRPAGLWRRAQSTEPGTVPGMAPSPAASTCESSSRQQLSQQLACPRRSAGDSPCESAHHSCHVVSRHDLGHADVAHLGHTLAAAGRAGTQGGAVEEGAGTLLGVRAAAHCLPAGAPCEQHVGRLDVEVDDAPAVQVHQCSRHVERDLLSPPVPRHPLGPQVVRQIAALLLTDTTTRWERV